MAKNIKTNIEYEVKDKLDKLDSLLRFDSIRILKLLEISQYAIISFLLSLWIGEVINSLFPTIDINISTYVLLTEAILQVFLLTVVVYYIRKISFIFPFIFNPIIKACNIPYIPSKKNESLFGITMGIGYVFYETQTNLINKVTEIAKRITIFNKNIFSKK